MSTDAERTWRVVEDGGETHAVTCEPGMLRDEWYVSTPVAHHSIAAKCARAAVTTFAERYFAVAEIRGPGEKTTAEQLTAATAEIERLQAALVRVDDPEADATDFAHPAWWRGHDHTSRVYQRELDKARAEAKALSEKCAWMRTELDPLTRRAETAEAVANEAMRVGRETCATLDEARRGLEEQVRYLDDSREEARAEIARLTKHVAGLEAAERLHQDALTIERLPGQVIVTLHDGDRMWSADESHLADALAAIVRAMREESADGDSEPECTGISAGWCPRCGDCTCPDRAQAMDTPTCPLHGTRSKHAEEPEADPRSDLTMRRARPTPEEFRALARLGGGDDADVLCRYHSFNEATFFAVERVHLEDGVVVVAESGEWSADAWWPLDGDGPMTPAEFERLKKAGGA